MNANALPVRSLFDSVDDSIHLNQAEEQEAATHPSTSTDSGSSHLPRSNPIFSSSDSSNPVPKLEQRRTKRKAHHDHDYPTTSKSKKDQDVKKHCSNLTSSSSSKSKLNCIIAKHSDDPSWDPSVLNPASARRAKSFSQLGLIYPPKGAVQKNLNSNNNDNDDNNNKRIISPPNSFHSSIGRKGSSHLGLGLIEPSRSSLEKQRSNLSGLESPLTPSERIQSGDLGETSDRGRRWYDAQLGQGKPSNKYISNSNDNSDLPYSSAYPSSQKGLHLSQDYKHPLSGLNPLKSDSGYRKSLLDDDELLSVPTWNRRPRTEAGLMSKRARDLTGRWTWRWSPGQGWIQGRSKDWGVYQLEGGVGNAMAALLPPSHPAGLSMPPRISHQSNSLFLFSLFLSLSLMLLLVFVLEDVLGFSIPSLIPLRTISRIGKRLPLPHSVKSRAMAIGNWAEEMKKVGADDDWGTFFRGNRDGFSTSLYNGGSSTTNAALRNRGGFYSRFRRSRDSGSRELTTSGIDSGNKILRSRSTNQNGRGSEEIALLSRNSLSESINPSSSLDGQNGSFEGGMGGIGVASSSSSHTAGSSTRAYAIALREICSRALSPLTSASSSSSDSLNFSSTNSTDSDPNELFSSLSNSNSKGKKKAKSSLDETLPSIINNGVGGGPTINRSSTPPLRPISPSTASLLRTHAHSPPIRSPLGLNDSSASPASIVDMKEVDPFENYASPFMNGGSGSRRPSHPPFSSSKLAQSSSSNWSNSSTSTSSNSSSLRNHAASPSMSKPRNGYEQAQTPGASPPSSPTQQDSNDSNSRALGGGVLVQVG